MPLEISRIQDKSPGTLIFSLGRKLKDFPTLATNLAFTFIRQVVSKLSNPLRPTPTPRLWYKMAKGKKVHEGGPPPSPGVSPTQEGQEFAKPKKAKHSKRGPSAIDLDLDTAPDSTSDQASKVKPDMDTGQNDAEDLIAKSTPLPPPPPENLPERKVIRNLWNVCCNGKYPVFPFE